MDKKSVWTSFFFVVLAVFMFVPSAFATTFDLVPPSGTLQRGQNITFTINIDTQGTVVTSIQTGLNFDSTLLQYVTATAGAAMNSVVADTTTYGAGKVLLTGTSNAGYNGTGVFASVVFTIIAQNPGSTEICTLWAPDATPTPTPIPTVGPSPTPTPIAPTLPPQPTALPVTGTTGARNTAVLLAVSFLAAAGGVFYLSQRQKYAIPHSSSKKTADKLKVTKQS